MFAVFKEMRARGNKNEVWNGEAKRTPGGLTKDDLTLNKRGKVVSKKMQEKGRRAFKVMAAARKSREDARCAKKIKVARGQARLEAEREEEALQMAVEKKQRRRRRGGV